MFHTESWLFPGLSASEGQCFLEAADHWIFCQGAAKHRGRGYTPALLQSSSGLKWTAIEKEKEKKFWIPQKGKCFVTFVTALQKSSYLMSKQQTEQH